jgi:hypothetical protein
MSNDTPRRALTGVDVDRERLVTELEVLVRALKEGDAYIQGVEHSQASDPEDIGTESVTLEYGLTNRFDGIDPIHYDVDGDTGGDGA